MWETKASRQDDYEIPLVEYESTPQSESTPRYESTAQYESTPTALQDSDPPESCFAEGCYGLSPRASRYVCGIIVIVILAIIIVPPTIVLTFIYPTKSYSGNLRKYPYGGSVVACGSTSMGDDNAIIAQSVFDHGSKGNSSSVCGHKISAKGSAIGGGYGGGVTVYSGKMSLTVVGYCPGCDDGDLIVTDETWWTMTPSVSESDGTEVSWKWLKPIPKLHI